MMDLVRGLKSIDSVGEQRVDRLWGGGRARVRGVRPGHSPPLSWTWSFFARLTALSYPYRPAYRTLVRVRVRVRAAVHRASS